MIVYFCHVPYTVYGAFDRYGDTYFILWDKDTEEFIEAPVKSCSAKKGELEEMYESLDI